MAKQVDYGSWTLVELRKELSNRKAKVSGRKHELIERLVMFDKNASSNAVNDAEYTMEVPDISCYKDLNSDATIPPISHENVNFYLQAVNKQISKMSIDMYNDGYVDYIRVATDDNLVYFKAQCRAQMKARISYIIDICVNELGQVQICQCECGAGMGPHAHCKHTCAILFGLIKYFKTGEFKTVKTCTETLQTFHAVGKHRGSPLKVADLTLAVNANIDFDPHPDHFVQQTNYIAYFKNHVINAQILQNTPIAQILTPANPIAVLLDHSYHTGQDPIESFLESNKITKITQDEPDALQLATIGQSDNPLWKAYTHQTNPSALARTLLNAKDIYSPAINYGKQKEAIAAKQYEEVTASKTIACGLFVCPFSPFLSASPDRVRDRAKLVEIKCPYSARNCLITEETVPYLVATDGQLQLKSNHDYYYQVQGQMLCAGADTVDFVIYTAKDLKIIQIERNDNFIGLGFIKNGYPVLVSVVPNMCTGNIKFV